MIIMGIGVDDYVCLCNMLCLESRCSQEETSQVGGGGGGGGGVGWSEKTPFPPQQERQVGEERGAKGGRGGNKLCSQESSEGEALKISYVLG